jgi:hypothetical protein
MLRDTIGQLYFNRTLNNYQLIKAHFNRERLPEDYSKVVTRGETGSNLCVKMEYRIEVTLSSHKAKKVQINIVRCSDRSYCWCLLWRMMKLGASMWMSLSSRKLGSMWRWGSGISIRSSPKVDTGTLYAHINWDIRHQLYDFGGSPRAGAASPRPTVLACTARLDHLPRLRQRRDLPARCHIPTLDPVQMHRTAQFPRFRRGEELLLCGRPSQPIGAGLYAG